MPLEISEIGVRIVIGEAPSAPPARAQGAAGMTPAQVEETIRAAMRDVLATLRMQEER